MGMRTPSSLSSNTILRVAAKATSMKAKERKRKQSPIMIFLVKMARDSKMAVTEENKPNASEIAKIMRESCPNNNGTPVLLSLPPGTVKAAANNTVAIRVEMSIHEFAVSFTHSSPFSINSLCSFTNAIQYDTPLS
ncbi:hypothetical protein BT93_L4969 [Corymbia citriodora subsp. variegata]|uniref:Uncharacterized protein n=1 Tax=Corymbia citriodora subsp. variegata TaxID=360336 RepID=A0A8T0CX88_CORYI|nr:hypothetical protein BT93_L4969 [Corymbia citriodora subsp. variegata]